MITILLIEDHPDLAEALREAFETDQYHVVVGHNGEDGLRLLRDRDELPHLIMCDMRMPSMDGFEFLRQLRANAVWESLYVIAMSGDKGDKLRALQAGANTYEPKPINIPRMQQMFANLFALD